MIGEIFKNSKGLDFQVLKLSKKDKNYKKYYDIKFMDSGYVARDVRSDTVRSGLVKDKLQKTLCNIGAIGYVNVGHYPKQYSTWSSMINRCYNKKDISFKYYGEKGVSVWTRWHRFDYFLEDIVKIIGYDNNLYLEGKLRLDKDIESSGDVKHYHIDNCTFVSDLDNQKQRAKEYNRKNRKIAIHPNGKEELMLNVSDFCKRHNLQRQNVRLCLIGQNTHHKGFTFRDER